MNNHVEVDTSVIEEMLQNRDVTVEKFPPIQQVPIATPTVDRILERFTVQWRKTADDCVDRAKELEAAAENLRERALYLYSCAEDYPDHVREAVRQEIEARHRAASLALVNPSDTTDTQWAK